MFLARLGGELYLARHLEIDRIEKLRAALERAQNDLAPAERVEERAVAVAHAQRAEFRKTPDPTPNRVFHGKGIELVPVEDDVVALGLADGEGERQRLQAWRCPRSRR
jgi:hypothetical protein